MISFKSSQLLDFIVLTGLLSVGLSVFLSLSHQPGQQLVSIALTGVGYVVWGIWHHLRHGNFYWQIVLEYFLVVVLVTVLTWSLLI